MCVSEKQQLHSCCAQTKIARTKKKNKFTKLKPNINSFSIRRHFGLFFFSECLVLLCIFIVQPNQSKRLLIHVYFVYCCDFSSSSTTNIITSYQITAYKNEGDISHLCSIQFTLLLNKNKKK